MLLKKGFEPTDFADADCRVTPWVSYEGHAADAYRIWICKCGNGYWFQRHEWSLKGKNAPGMDGWIFTGYSPRRSWPTHLVKAPDNYEAA